MTTTASSNSIFTCKKCGFAVDVTESEVVVSNNLLDSLSTSNNPPSPNELAILTGEYNTITQTISSFDTEMVLLQAKLDALKSKRQELSSSLEAYRIALNPCRRLPNEVLAFIFDLCVKEDVDIDGRMVFPECPRVWWPGTLDTRKMPWVLGQVCHRWRNLALSLPDLWTAIDFNWEDPPEEVMDPFIERRLWMALRRCQDRPLQILWNEKSGRDRAVLTMLCSRSFQWKVAVVVAGIKGFRYLTPYSGGFPNLSTLHLHFAGEPEEWIEIPENSPIYSVFQDAPALRRLTLTGESTIARRLSKQIPWNQITHLTVRGGWRWLGNREVRNMWHDFHILLPRLTNVMELSLHSFSCSRLELNSPLKLAALHTLDLYEGTSGSVSNLLDSLTLPSLRRLAIDSAFAAKSSTVPLLDRSACQLERFEASDIEDDLALLSATQLRNIHDFCVGGEIEYDADGSRAPNTVSDTVLNALKFPPARGASRPNIFPHVTQLTLKGDFKEWSDTALVEMLASRRDIDRFPPGSVSRLQRVEFSRFGRYLAIKDAGAARKLRRLIEGGLVINNGNASVLLG